MTPRLFVIPHPVHIAVFYGAPLIAFWRGGWRERLIASIAAVQFAATEVWPIGWGTASHVTRGVRSLGGDAVLLLACLACLRGARRYWVVWAAAFALLSVVTDVVFLVAPDITNYAFISADDAWAYGVIATVMWGVFGRPRERRTAD